MASTPAERKKLADAVKAKGSVEKPLPVVPTVAEKKLAPKPAPRTGDAVASGMKKPAKGANAVTRKILKPKRGK